MSQLRDQIKNAMKTAMREKDSAALSTTRMVLAALKDADIHARSSGNQDGIDDTAVLSLLH